MFQNCKLGLKEPDHGRVAMVPAFPADQLICTTPMDWQAGRAWDGDMLGNLQYNDCGPAAAVNILKLLALCNNMPLTFSVQDALDTYGLLGWDGTPATDQGVVLLDLMYLWQRVGIGGIPLSTFWRIGFGDPAHVATAISTGGPLLGAFRLPLVCKSTDQWDDIAAADTREWGPHAVALFASSDGWLRGKSWGRVVDISPRFIIAKCMEMYLPVSKVLRAPSGVPLDRLLRLGAQL